MADWERKAYVAGNVVDAQQLLDVLLHAPNLGVAVCDRQLRYCLVNRTLAAMNGLPAEAHLGKTVREVLGELANKVEPYLERVLRVGSIVKNVNLTGAMPEDPTGGEFVDHFFPIRNSEGEVTHVAALVLDVSGDTAGSSVSSPACSVISKRKS